MLGDTKVIGFIPIRKGSKSIPDKNIKYFCGKELVYWMARAMNDCEYVDEVCIFTDYEILPNFEDLEKVTFYSRKDENATDASTSEKALLEFLDTKNISDSVIVFGQATSPLTTSDDIKRGLELYKDNINDKDTVVSAVKTKRFFWDIKSGMPVNYNYLNRPRRQDFEGCYMENGAFYINNSENIKSNSCRIGKFPSICEMPDYTAYEIDEPNDWIVMEQLARENGLCKTNIPIDEKYITFYPFETASKREVSPLPKLFITDVDGTLTDGGMYYGASVGGVYDGPNGGVIMKKFNTKDGFAVHKLREAGVKTAIITSELDPTDNECVRVRASKLKYDYCIFCKGRSKIEVAREICDELGISFSEVAMVGDSENDLPLLKLVGDAFCPADSHPRVRAIEGITITNRKGGEGVLREITDDIYKL